MAENNRFRELLRENFVPWDITGQRYSPEHAFFIFCVTTRPKLLINDRVKINEDQ